jgi:hypothetical protein
VGVDINRVVASAIEAAFETDEHHAPQRGRHRGLKALAAGAALVATARVVAGHAPKLSKLGGLAALSKVTHLPDVVKDAPDRLRDRLADFEEPDEEVEPDEDIEPEDEEPEEEEPEGEADDGPDDGGDSPDDEEDEGGSSGGEADDDVEPDDEEQPSAVATGEGSAIEQAVEGLDIDTNGHRASRERHIDPVARPPEPPPAAKSEAGSG